MRCRLRETGYEHDICPWSHLHKCTYTFVNRCKSLFYFVPHNQGGLATYLQRYQGYVISFTHGFNKHKFFSTAVVTVNSCGQKSEREPVPNTMFALDHKCTMNKVYVFDIQLLAWIHVWFHSIFTSYWNSLNKTWKNTHAQSQIMWSFFVTDERVDEQGLSANYILPSERHLLNKLNSSAWNGHLICPNQ